MSSSTLAATDEDRQKLLPKNQDEEEKEISGIINEPQDKSYSALELPATDHEDRQNVLPKNQDELDGRKMKDQIKEIRGIIKTQAQEIAELKRQNLLAQNTQTEQTAEIANLRTEMKDIDNLESQSTDAVELLKDFTALYFVSEIDNIMYDVAKKGYFGNNLKKRVQTVEEVRLNNNVQNTHEESTTETLCASVFAKQSVLVVLFFVMLGMWSYVVYGQESGKFFKQKYPKCTMVPHGDCQQCVDAIGKENVTYIGDGICNGGAYATEACAYDGGDCQECVDAIGKENVKYIGDGICNGGAYATEACGYDGGDCDDCIASPSSDMRTNAIGIDDVNNDGHPDIVVGNLHQSNQLLLNDGSGAFPSAEELPGGYMPTDAIGIADVNNDGHPDIIIGNFGQSNQLLLNDGSGAFPSVVDLLGGNMNTRAIGIADVNNDGHPDIVVGNWGVSNQLLLNDGNGTFPSAVDLPGGDMNTTAIGVADVNNDGHPDIILGNYAQGNQLFLNDGNGAFPSAEELPGGYTEAIGIADVNNDGHPDILVGNWYGQSNQLLLNDGNGAFPSVVDLPGGNMFTVAIGIGDVNNDGYVDIVIGDSVGRQENQILINNGDGSFQEPISLPCSGDSKTMAIALSDVDNDGFLDIVVGNWKQYNQVLINLGDGISFKPPGDGTNSDWWLP